jgi:crossover junction endodeoxyribonuclease RusA
VTGANEVVLPWPCRDLHPNARGHWAKKANAAKAYRNECWVRAKVAKMAPLGDGKIKVSIVFVPPDRRRRDVDGMLSAIKSGLDGMAQAMGVDDHRFELSLGVAERVGAGGFVRVMVW